MELIRRGGVVAALSVGLLALSLGKAAPAEAAWCSPGWRVEKTLAAGSTLKRVSALPGMAWAIGAGPYREGGSRDPLVMRYDGGRWSETPVPGIDDLAAMYPFDLRALEDKRIELEGVFARGASDAWVVGYFTGNDVDGTVFLPITMRWDGTAWRFVRAPRPPAAGYLHWLGLRDVVAFGPDDVWAVGGWSGEGRGQPIAMHWDGTRWTLDRRAELDPSFGSLHAVARTPYSKTLWTVGHRWGLTESQAGLAERYSSSSGTWTQATLPGDRLNDVAVSAWNDVWAVGRQPDGSAVALHRDGTRWSVVPDVGGPGRTLNAVSAPKSSKVWMAGSQATGALITRWDGSSWTDEPAPAGVRFLQDVAVHSSGYGWAVSNEGVILRRCP